MYRLVSSALAVRNASSLLNDQRALFFCGFWGRGGFDGGVDPDGEEEEAAPPPGAFRYWAAARSNPSSLFAASSAASPEPLHHLPNPFCESAFALAASASFFNCSRVDAM